MASLCSACILLIPSVGWYSIAARGKNDPKKSSLLDMGGGGGGGGNQPIFEVGLWSASIPKSPWATTNFGEGE